MYIYDCRIIIKIIIVSSIYNAPVGLQGKVNFSSLSFFAVHVTDTHIHYFSDTVIRSSTKATHFKSTSLRHSEHDKY